MSASLPLLSIGAVSREVGLPASTLRTWERRYGRPRAERTPAGHRRYPRSEVAFLETVRRALEQGHRPSTVVGLNEADLHELLAPRGSTKSRHLDVEGWLEHVLALDGPGLERALCEHLTTFGARSFVAQVVELMTRVGDGWRPGKVTIAQEHLASAVIQAFLARQWMPLADGPGPSVALCTLPGEHHGLPLHLAALLLGLRRARLVFVGPNVPVEDVVTAAERTKAAAVLISFSPAPNPTAVANLRSLEARLAPKVVLAAGGAVPEARGRATALASFDALDGWYESLVVGKRPQTFGAS